VEIRNKQIKISEALGSIVQNKKQTNKQTKSKITYLIQLPKSQHFTAVKLRLSIEGYRT
jgi:hypothetical protein